MGDFTMPSLGADMEAGTVSRWLVKPGDEVHRGDVVAVVETEKSTIEVEIFESGVIGEILVPEGERVPVGTVLAQVGATAPAAGARKRAPRPAPTRTVAPTTAPAIAPTPRVGAAPTPRVGAAPTARVGAAPTAGTPPATAAPAAGAAPVAPPPPLAPPANAPPAPPIVHSPVVRHLAERLGVDLGVLKGTGPGGTVTRADVEQAASARPRTRSSPLARRRARELGIDLSEVRGSGPGGSVLERDVVAAGNVPLTPQVPPGQVLGPEMPPGPSAASPAAERAPAGVGERQAAMRRAIGALMARSKREIPHYYLSTTIDMGAATGWLERSNLERPVEGRLVLPVLLLKATALAVTRVPEMNGFFLDGAFVPSEAVHVGVAISLRGGGVIAPAVHDTDRLSLDDLMVRLRDLVGRARAGVLRSSEMSDPTITVTNLGDLGVEAVFGVIYPPQVALVGFGRVVERAIAQGGLVGARPCVTATLSADHRVSDGHRGARLLAEIDRLLQEPERL